MTATCSTCGTARAFSTVKTASDWLYEHDLTVHRGQHLEVTQLDYVTFRAAFLNAVRAMPIGHEFTTADLHAVVPEPLDHHWWGKAQADARKLGLCERIGTQPSDLDTTKDSLVRRWRRVDEHRKAA